MMINSALGIIGYPIGHSISPRFQQAGLDYLSVDHRYLPHEVHPDQVADFVASLRADAVRGINVTVPHKETVMPFLDEIDEWAAEAGAVNTIVNRGGRLVGYNTDGYGFLRALRESAGLDPRWQTRFDPGRGEAHSAGASTLGGISMLVYQGAASFELWLERPAPVSVMMDAAMSAMREREALAQ
ncbi:Shikimate dehydrogenase (NADP(+)) [Geodia barretti]|uniref:Shikimate dehydrogenase (NADP(+)) n=1 Tax=Geodia barretti TaxID=519541 RepID=A0AA35TZ89_GEOBA|nr:Shikimate dehydrogenase (NADP(+)) [Geodia barretti]